jgi:hypothetical protein
MYVIVILSRAGNEPLNNVADRRFSLRWPVAVDPRQLENDDRSVRAWYDTSQGPGADHKACFRAVGRGAGRPGGIGGCWSMPKLSVSACVTNLMQFVLGCRRK